MGSHLCLAHYHNLSRVLREQRGQFCPNKNRSMSIFGLLLAIYLYMRKSRWNFSDLASPRFLNSHHPCKLITLDSLRFFTVPDTFKSSSEITWLLLIIFVDSLCRKSFLLSAVWLCSVANLTQVLFLVFESF